MNSAVVTSMGYLVVFVGAGIGGALRHGINIAAARALGVAFPYGTLAVNITGGFLMGLIVEYLARKGGFSHHWRLFLTTGILGGFTTFSAFSVEVALLYQRGQAALAVGYILASVLLCVGALFVGLFIVRALS